MATDKQVIHSLKRLVVYYGREPTDEQAEIYVDLLGDLEAWRLRNAVRDWMRKSPFFPKVSELRELALAFPEPRPDYLAAEASYLADKFYFTGELDQEEWDALIKRFERAERPHRAANLRKRFGIYCAMGKNSKDKEDQREPTGEGSE
jgi:hypothetical protein